MGLNSKILKYLGILGINSFKIVAGFVKVGRKNNLFGLRVLFIFLKYFNFVCFVQDNLEILMMTLCLFILILIISRAVISVSKRMYLLIIEWSLLDSFFTFLVAIVTYKQHKTITKSLLEVGNILKISKIMKESLKMKYLKNLIMNLFKKTKIYSQIITNLTFILSQELEKRTMLPLYRRNIRKNGLSQYP